MEFNDFINKIRKWGEKSGFVSAVVLVGSYARGTYKEDSDIDLIILTKMKDYIVSNPDIFGQFGRISRFDTEYYGACTSIRVWYEDGMEVEYGIVNADWIAMPLDTGTRRVLEDGYKVIVDKNNHFKDIGISEFRAMDGE